MDVEIAAEDRVRPDVVPSEPAEGEGRLGDAFHRGGLRLPTSLARGAPSRAVKSLTRTPAPVMILEGSKCWTPSRWVVTISSTSAIVLRGCDMALFRTTRFTEVWVAGIDDIVRGKENRSIWCVGFGRP